LVEYWNQRWYDYSGSSPEQALGHGWSQFLHPDDSQHTLTVWHHALETGDPYEVEAHLREGQTGVYRWFLARGMPVRDEAGQILQWVGTGTDIEGQVRIEEVLCQSQERANALMNSNIIGINVIEGEQIVDANDTFLRMTGYTREDLRAGRLHVMDITAPEDRAQAQQAHQALTVRQALTPYEKEYICQDGSRLPVLVGGVVFQHDPFQAIGFALDNSARKELELRKDDFISMASHELRTPLTAVKIQTQLVRRRLVKQAQHEIAAELSRVEEPVKQLERLIAELLDVSKIQAGRLEYR
jgi:PAS domain S-box-containing protein